VPPNIERNNPVSQLENQISLTCSGHQSKLIEELLFNWIEFGKFPLLGWRPQKLLTAALPAGRSLAKVAVAHQNLGVFADGVRRYPEGGTINGNRDQVGAR